MAARFVELTAIDLNAERSWLRAVAEATSGGARTVDFDEDDLEQPLRDPDEGTAPAPAASTDPATAPAGTYYAIAVFESDLREFYARKGNRTGTRLVYRNGAARPVKETYNDVKAKFAALK